MNLSRNDLEPGTAIESQAKGHPATGTEEAGRASQGATPATSSERGLTNPTGCPPLSHTKPRLLDLFCCAGGAAMGYHRAGFDVIGVDIDDQRNYPFEFHRADATKLVFVDQGPAVDHRYMTVNITRFAAIHASPPCQRWAGGFVKDRGIHPDYIQIIREKLAASGLPYVIENVRDAPLLEPTIICGGGLGLKAGELQLHRHRYFETNFPMMGVPCARIARHTVSVVGNGTPSGNRITIGRNPSIAEKREAMGIDWTTRAELSEAIPPAYTEYIGGYLLAEINQRGRIAA